MRKCLKKPKEREREKVRETERDAMSIFLLTLAFFLTLIIGLFNFPLIDQLKNSLINKLLSFFHISRWM